MHPSRQSNQFKPGEAKLRSAAQLQFRGRYLRDFSGTFRQVGADSSNPFLRSRACRYHFPPADNLLELKELIGVRHTILR